MVDITLSIRPTKSTMNRTLLWFQKIYLFVILCMKYDQQWPNKIKYGQRLAKSLKRLKKGFGKFSKRLKNVGNCQKIGKKVKKVKILKKVKKRLKKN